MSYASTPQRAYARLQVGSQYHDLGVEVTTESCPQQIQDFLKQAGWKVEEQDANTYEPLFTKKGEEATELMRYRWYEAIAYEFWKFLTLTNGND